jgi:hypothetical protein
VNALKGLQKRRSQVAFAHHYKCRSGAWHISRQPWRKPVTRKADPSRPLRVADVPAWSVGQ